MQQQYFRQTHDGGKVKQKFVSDQAKQNGLYCQRSIRSDWNGVSVWA
jgi:hypothetical protein